MCQPTLDIKTIATGVVIQRYADEIGEPESMEDSIKYAIEELVSQWQYLPWVLDMAAYNTQIGLPNTAHYGLAHAIISSGSYKHYLDFQPISELVPKLIESCESWTEVIEYLLGDEDSIDTMEQIIPIYKAHALHLGYKI